MKDCAKEELVVFSKIQVIKVYSTSRGTTFARKFKFRLLTLQPYNYTHAKETALHTLYFCVRITWQIPRNVKSTLPDRTDFGTWRMYSQGTYLIIRLLCNVSIAMIESKQSVILNIDMYIICIIQ